MGFKFKKKESVAAGIRRIAAEQIEKAISEIDDGQRSEAIKIHQVRKRCKKLRGLIRIVGPGFGKQYGIENDHLRDTAKLLSALRDAKILLQTFNNLLAQAGVGSDRFEAIGQHLRTNTEEISTDHNDVRSRLQTVRERLSDTKRRISDWSIREGGFAALRRGLKETYGEAKKAMQNALDDPATEALHQWRKHVKYHGYQCRLLTPLWPPLMDSRSKEAGQLGDWLGDDHDLAVLSEHLDRDSERFGEEDDLPAFIHILQRRRGKLQSQCWGSGARLFAEDPKVFAKRHERYWKIWRSA
jgi:CHAD domain-containing protein